MELRKMKIRERGLIIGQYPTGKHNCLTDVPGVKVGHITLHKKISEEEHACTGVTAILPHEGNLFLEKVVAASYVINGFGKTTGLVQLDELGLLESPIMLSNTFAVPAVTHGTIEYMLKNNREIGDTTGTINIVTGECNDGYLNSIRELPIKPEHAIEAIENAVHTPCEEGAVGAGKGMVCFGYKGGIGTSSRIVADNNQRSYHLGCLVLSNFGGKVEFPFDKYMGPFVKDKDVKETPDGSIMIILGTDIPLTDRQLKRIAKRCGIGLGRTGSNYSHGSGDIVIAFSNGSKIPHHYKEDFSQQTVIREDHPIMNEIFSAAAEVTEEAILNSLSQAETTTGRKGRTVYSLFS